MVPPTRAEVDTAVSALRKLKWYDEPTASNVAVTKTVLRHVASGGDNACIVYRKIFGSMYRITKEKYFGAQPLRDFVLPIVVECVPHPREVSKVEWRRRVDTLYALCAHASPYWGRQKVTKEEWGTVCEALYSERVRDVRAASGRACIGLFLLEREAGVRLVREVREEIVSLST
jgi:hypothetical protein